jgi:hypothetical protein
MHSPLKEERSVQKNKNILKKCTLLSKTTQAKVLPLENM